MALRAMTGVTTGAEHLKLIDVPGQVNAMSARFLEISV